MGEQFNKFNDFIKKPEPKKEPEKPQSFYITLTNKINNLFNKKDSPSTTTHTIKPKTKQTKDETKKFDNRSKIEIMEEEIKRLSDERQEIAKVKDEFVQHLNLEKELGLA